jgi:Zn-ribbon RNA-binding protein
METKVCISTKKKVDNDNSATSFMCPKCGKFEIVRSTFARKNAMKYTCPNCDFTGPN